MKKILNEGNQIHNFISSSDFFTNYDYGSGSGSTSQKVTVPTVPVPVPVPQHCKNVTDPENCCGRMRVLIFFYLGRAIQPGRVILIAVNIHPEIQKENHQ
jgi:hypothetical protein